MLYHINCQQFSIASTVILSVALQKHWEHNKLPNCVIGTTQGYNRCLKLSIWSPTVQLTICDHTHGLKLSTRTQIKSVIIPTVSNSPHGHKLNLWSYHGLKLSTWPQIKSVIIPMVSDSSHGHKLNLWSYPWSQTLHMTTNYQSDSLRICDHKKSLRHLL